MSNWKHTLHISDIFHDPEMSLEAKTETIVARIKGAKWYEESNYNGELAQVLEELTDAAEADNVAVWDITWNAFYGHADADRIWIKTR